VASFLRATQQTIAVVERISRCLVPTVRGEGSIWGDDVSICLMGERYLSGDDYWQIDFEFQETFHD